MTRTLNAGCLAFVLAAAGTLHAEDKQAPKLEWKGKKGDAVAFTVERSSSMEMQGQRDFKSSDESQVQYRFEVADAKGPGEFELKVTYVSVKAKQEGGDRKFEFDSSKKEGGDEIAGALREAMGRSITVKVAGGKVSDIAGFPEVRPPEGGQPDFRGMRARGLVSRRALEQDLDLILARAVQGQTLEKGKEYRLAREEGDSASGRGRGAGRGFFGRSDGPLVFKYEGEEEVGGQSAARFSLAADTSRRPGADAGFTMERKSEGTAQVSLKDGGLLKLEVKSQSKTEGERNGQSFKSSGTSKTVIQRGSAPKPKEATV